MVVRDVLDGEDLAVLLRLLVLGPEGRVRLDIKVKVYIDLHIFIKENLIIITVYGIDHTLKKVAILATECVNEEAS